MQTGLKQYPQFCFLQNQSMPVGAGQRDKAGDDTSIQGERKMDRWTERSLINQRPKQSANPSTNRDRRGVRWGKRRQERWGGKIGADRTAKWREEGQRGDSERGPLKDNHGLSTWRITFLSVPYAYMWAHIHTQRNKLTCEGTLMKSSVGLTGI